MKRWQRKDYIFWAIVVAIVLGSSAGLYFVERRHRMPGLVRNPPWLMWGNSQTIELNQTNPNTAPKVTSQLVRVAYARPENWTFLFYCELVQVKGLGNATLDVNFNLTTGLGRSQVSISALRDAAGNLLQPGFEHYRFNITGPVNNGDRRYSTEVIAPDRGLGGPNVLDNLIKEFPGQDIQLNVELALSSLTTQDVVVRVDAYLTPKLHMRPEWFKGKMGQEEDQGR